MKAAQQEYERRLKNLEAELASEGSWGGIAKGVFQSTVHGLGAVLSSIPVIIKIKPESSEKSASKIYTKMEMLKGLLEDIEKKTEKLDNIQQIKTDKIRETMSKLTEINASKATEEDVLKILEKCIKSLAATKKNWEALVKFFDNINVWIEQCTDKVTKVQWAPLNGIADNGINGLKGKCILIDKSQILLSYLIC